MNHVHDKDVNSIAECNLLHDKLNTSKYTKYINSHYSPILHVCINTRRGGAKYKTFGSC